MTELLEPIKPPEISTKFTEYMVEDSGLINVSFKAKMKQQIKVMDAETHASIMLQLTDGKKRLFLLNFLQFNNLPNPKIIAYLAGSKEIHDVCIAKAVVLNSVAMRVIVRQYIKLVQPNYPFEVFKTELDARTWLKSYI